MMVNGATFFIDHIAQTTHWAIPVVAVPQYGVFLPLPAGWEQRMFPEPHFFDTVTGSILQHHFFNI